MKPSEATLGEAEAERLVMPDNAGRRANSQSPSRSSIRDETRTSTLALNAVLSANSRDTATSPTHEPNDIQGYEGEENSRGSIFPVSQEDCPLHRDPFPQQQRNVASATLVARGSLKSGHLWKMGSNVPRWKRRYFVLKPITMLFYYMSEHDTEPRGCIDLDLFDAVRRVGVGQGASSSTPNRTAFELYRSGFPEGSGFMLEARGQEDWEEWVEMIANCRHGKIQAETDVLKGTNKLLLEEIRGLEHQVATFRGYADQRHVTVLALRDERHRSRELSLELAALGDMASALSGYIVGFRNRYFSWEDATNCAASRGSLGKTDNVESPPATSSRDTLPTVNVARIATVQPNKATAEQVTTFSGEPNARPSAGSPSEAPETSTATTADSELNSDESTRERERRSLEAMRRALAEARREIDFMGMRLLEAHEAQKLAKSKLADIQNAARAAEQRSAAAEEAASKARGRTEVLERNVEYLQWQQDGLRAQLCRAKKQTQVIRAQKGLLKKEVRELWARKDVPEIPTKNALVAEKGTGVRRSRYRAGVTPMPESRSWRSMSDLAKAGDAETGTPSTSLEQSDTCIAVASSRRDGGDLEMPQNGGGAIAGAVVGDLRLSVSGVSLGASDGGDTDMAEQSASEASDEESDKGQGARPRAGSSREGGVVIDRIRRRIRRQVGEASIPPLPRPRQHRILEAVRKMSSPDTDFGVAPSVASVNVGGSIQGMVASRSSPSLMLGGNGNAHGAAGNGPGLGVAGMILSGLGKGMVEKAAQARRGLSERRGSSSAGDAGVGVSLGLRSAASTSSLAGVASGAPAVTLRGAEVLGGAALTNTVSRTPLIQLNDLEKGGLCERPEADGTPSACVATSPQPEEVAASWQSGNCNRVSLPPRPQDEYELVFTSRVIGLQFGATPRNQSVVVQGRKGYMGAAPSGVPGERSSPNIGDVLESYNGVSARGKSVEVVGREIAACGRPLRLGFRSTRMRTSSVAGMVAAAAVSESEGESEGDDWAFRDTPDLSVEKVELKVSGDGGVGIAPVNNCGVAQGVVDATMRMHGGEGAWRELMSVTPAWARS